MSNTAIILIALGGPKDLDDVGPFMTAFMGRPAPLPVVSAVIERYKLIGGKSPLPEIVKAQAMSLAKELGNGYRVYEGFRYSSPTIEESYEKAARDGATHVIGLSLSPFETEVTTGTYRSAFDLLGDGSIEKIFIPSWHDNAMFIDAWEERVSDGLLRLRPEQQSSAVVIFTSHSIPTRYIAAGDPYQWQIEETIKRIVARLNIRLWRMAWQSKGTRATEPWLGPEVEPTLDKIKQEGYESVLEVPIGFTCDNMETLYDIDILHRSHAKKLGIEFERAESLNMSKRFINALADIVKKA
jgi:protoporphyrin/coproporphyrin ferrochelatase